VEDDNQVREFAVKALARNGYVVFEVASAQEALEIIEREGGKFNLVFSDVVLSGQTGLQLVDQLLSRYPKLPILLGSGYTDQKSQWPVIRERGFRFLQKPYAVADLLRAIREAIDSRPSET
jgi:two-component system cell cycle sensor histidine kinase/response regulator CckA